MAANGPLQLRFKVALELFPVRRRITEVLLILNECTLKEQQTLYQGLVESIFGITGLGWNLRGTSRTESADAFDAVFKFLYPHGTFFEMVYRLLSDVYLKYEYNVIHLPASFRSALQQGNVSRFFLDKLNVDPVTRAPLSFHLNAYEFYMFHFGFHLLSPFHARRQVCSRSGHDTVYLHLSDQYISHLFPVETSVVLPVVHLSHVAPLSPPPQMSPVSKYIKPSAYKNILANASATVSQSHAENWRSDILMQIIMYFWLHVPPEQRGMDSFSPNRFRTSLDNSFGMDWDEARATGDHLRAVRNLIKHVHYFANNVRNDGSTMDEIRRSIRSVLQQPLYQFLRHNIQHWPLDSSFLTLLETYLCCIQPWRYQSYNAESKRGRTTQVDQFWGPYILEHFETYSAIITDLISRFSRMDLESPRNAFMIYRLTGVLALPGLANLLYAAELAVEKRGDVDSHVSMFSGSMEELLESLLKNMKRTMAVVSAQEKAVQEQPSRPFTQILREFIMGPSNEDYSSADRQNTLAYLERASQWLTSIFGVEAPEDEHPGASPSVEPALLDPLVAQKRAAFFKYSGNPDLQPIWSTECATLVRLLHKFSVSINQVHGPQIAELWYRNDFYGRVARQFLAPPCLAYHFEKTAPGMPAPRVATSLPPRVCLRPLAAHRTFFIIFFLIFFPYVMNYSCPLFHLTVFVGYCVYVAVKAGIEPYLATSRQQEEREFFIPPDISFNE